MKHNNRILALASTVVILGLPSIGLSQTLTIGVASNFYSTIKTITDKLHAEDHNINFTIIKGSSTVLTAQIQNGADIDLFFSADQQKPTYIYAKSKKHFKNMEKPFAYAQGKLVYYSYHKNKKAFTNASIKNTLLKDAFVMANPKKAPYGLASKEYISNALKINMNTIKNHTVLRSNISLTFSAVYMGNVNSGFVAYSSIITKKIPTSQYKILNDGYNPILQYAVILKNNTLAHKVIDFMHKPTIIKIIQHNGYVIPKEHVK